METLVDAAFTFHLSLDGTQVIQLDLALGVTALLIDSRDLLGSDNSASH